MKYIVLPADLPPIIDLIDPQIAIALTTLTTGRLRFAYQAIPEFPPMIHPSMRIGHTMSHKIYGLDDVRIRLNSKMASIFTSSTLYGPVRKECYNILYRYDLLASTHSTKHAIDQEFADIVRRFQVIEYITPHLRIAAAAYKWDNSKVPTHLIEQANKSGRDDAQYYHGDTPSTPEMAQWIRDNIKPNFHESSNGEPIFSMYVPNADMATLERLAGDRLPAISARIQELTQRIWGRFITDPCIFSQIALIKGCDTNDNKVAMLNDLLNSYSVRIYILAATQDDAREHTNNHTERKDEFHNG